MKKAVLFFMVVFLVGITVSVFRDRTRLSENSLRELVTVGRGTCANQQGRTAFITCFRKFIQPATTDTEIAQLMKLVAEEYINNAVPNSPIVSHCHDIAHSIGQRASEILDPTKALLSCNTICAAGCYHGVVEGLIAKGKAIKDLAVNLCDSTTTDTIARSRWACFHGLGHGIANITGSLEKSFALCEEVAGEDDKKNCDRGVLMELTQSGSFEHAKVSLSSDFVSFCAALVEPHRGVCFENAGVTSYAMRRNTKDAFAACGRVPETSHESCFGLLGNLMYHETGNDTKKVLEFCMSSARPLACIYGAVHESVLSDPVVRTGSAICFSADETFRSSCFAYLGERIVSIYGDETRRTVCQSVANPYQAVCMGVMQ